MKLGCSCRELEHKAAALVKLALLCCVLQNRQEQKSSGYVVMLPEDMPSSSSKEISTLGK